MADAQQLLRCNVWQGDRAKGDLNPEGERLLSSLISERHGHEFVFVTEYPISVRPFYHLRRPAPAAPLDGPQQLAAAVQPGHFQCPIRTDEVCGRQYQPDLGRWHTPSGPRAGTICAVAQLLADPQ